jgi:hypothetical protein
MSLARFRVLAAHIRFDDDGTRRGQHGRWQNDKFAAMRYPPPQYFSLHTIVHTNGLLNNCQRHFFIIDSYSVSSTPRSSERILIWFNDL